MGSVYRIEWVRNAYSYVRATSLEEALAKAEKGEDYDFEDPADTYGEDVAGWRAVSAEVEEE